MGKPSRTLPQSAASGVSASARGPGAAGGTVRAEEDRAGQELSFGDGCTVTSRATPCPRPKPGPKGARTRGAAGMGARAGRALLLGLRVLAALAAAQGGARECGSGTRGRRGRRAGSRKWAGPRRGSCTRGRPRPDPGRLDVSLPVSPGGRARLAGPSTWVWGFSPLPAFVFVVFPRPPPAPPEVVTQGPRGRSAPRP